MKTGSRRTGDSNAAGNLRFRAVTEETLCDLQAFSTCHGKFGYCSCMRWRMRSSEFQKSSKEQRAERLATMVRAGTPVGILAYAGELPVGWCSIAPRESYAALEGYKALPRIDSEPVWAVACFSVDAQFRRRGVTLGLLKAAVKFARERGARIVEGYPADANAASYQWMGSASTFLLAGFEEVTPPGQKRQGMRRMV